jgi:sarcosine oxidase gamma subunit
METGSAKRAERSQQDRAAWEALDPETRERVAFLSPDEFTVADGEESARQWQRFVDVLDRAERHEAL